jgi:acylglycerol lipase
MQAVDCVLDKVTEYIFSSDRLNRLIKRRQEMNGLDGARRILDGERVEKETYTRRSSADRHLFCRRWSPPKGTKVRAVAFICHGFTEHLGNYNSVGEYLSSAGIYCFGHDHIGHGLSEIIDKQKAYVPDLMEYEEDIVQHVGDIAKQLEHDYDVTGLPVFCVAHSMGGMVATRVAIDHPTLFKAIVLVGPLIYPGPHVWRHLPYKSFFGALNWVAQTIWKGVEVVENYFDFFMTVGVTNVDRITTDIFVRRELRQDTLRHFGGANLKMLAMFSDLMNRNRNDFSKMTTPFLVMYGSQDYLCNPKGGWDMFFHTLNLDGEQKKMLELQHAGHQLFLEIPQVREMALRETLEFLEERFDPRQELTLSDEHYASGSDQ